MKKKGYSVKAAGTIGCRVCQEVVLEEDFNKERIRCNRCCEEGNMLTSEARVAKLAGLSKDDLMKVWSSEKTCSKCKSTYPGWMFELRAKSKSFTSNECKKCASARKRKPRYRPSKELAMEYKKRHREKKALSSNPHMDNRITRKKSITSASYNSMLSSQCGKCAICGIEASSLKRNLAIDHDHNCCNGTVCCGHCIRGLLCSKCNTALGLLNHDRKTILSAYSYMSKSVVRAIGISGWCGSGKDTLASHISERHKHTRVGFADAIREEVYQDDLMVVAKEWSRPIRSIIDEIGWDRAKREIIEVREILQETGSMRRKQCDSYWIDKVIPRSGYKFIEMYPNGVVIPDVRHENEALRIRSIGGVIVRIERDGCSAVNSHESEGVIEGDFVILNNREPEDMFRSFDLTVMHPSDFREVLPWQS